MAYSTFQDLDLHDAILDKITVNWELKSCIAHLTLIGNRPVALQWHALESLSLGRKDSWGPSSHVLQSSVRDNVWELEMQSGDRVRVSAAGCAIEHGPQLPERYASVIVDALADAGLLQRSALTSAATVVATEISARRALGDS